MIAILCTGASGLFVYSVNKQEGTPFSIQHALQAASRYCTSPLASRKTTSDLGNRSEHLVYSLLVLQVQLGCSNFSVQVRFSVLVLESRTFLGSVLGFYEESRIFFCFSSIFMILVDICRYSLIFSVFFLGFSIKKNLSISRSILGVRNCPWFGFRFFLVVKNLSLVHVTVYFREYKYRPYNSIIGLYRQAICHTLKLFNTLWQLHTLCKLYSQLIVSTSTLITPHLSNTFKHTKTLNNNLQHLKKSPTT